MNSTPTPLPDSRRPIFEQLARASWLSVVISICTNLVFQVGFGPSTSRETTLIRALPTALFVLIGIVSGIVAICAVPRYGRKGLLWPALTGILLWISLFIIAVPTLLRARQLAQSKRTILLPVKHSPSAKRVEDAELHFAFDLPD